MQERQSQRGDGPARTGRGHASARRTTPKRSLRPDGLSRTPDSQFLRKLWQSGREQWRHFVLVGILLWAAYSLLLSPGGTIHLTKLRHQANRLEEEIGRLEGTRDSLDLVLQAVDEKDAFVLERIVREEFGFARDNERIYILPPDPEDRSCLDRANGHGLETAAPAGKQE